jgi:hypothetical protein
LSDDALATARVGALRGLAATSSAVEFARAEIEKGVEEGNDKWTASLVRIDVKALSLVAEDVESMLNEHGDVFLPPPPLEAAGGGTPAGPIEQSVVSSAEVIGASPQLWASLSDELKEALVSERVLGKSPGPHSTGDFWFHEQH